MKFVIVLVLLVGVAAANSDRALRSVSEAMRSLNKRQLMCTAKQVNNIVGSCGEELARLSTNVDFTNSTEFLEEFCASDCVEPVVKVLDTCFDFSFGFSLDDLIRQYCAENHRNETCVSLQSTITEISEDISTNCLSAGFYLPDPLVCPENCSSVLENSNAEIGCCISLANITGLTDILPVANYSLWSACGVDPLGFCPFSAGGASVTVSSFLLVILLAIVALVK